MPDGDLMTLRYFGPDRHADWCRADPTHEGFCLDLFLAAMLGQSDDPSTPGTTPLRPEVP